MTYKQHLMLSASPYVLLIGMLAMGNKDFYYGKVIQSAMQGCLWLPKMAKS